MERNGGKRPGLVRFAVTLYTSGRKAVEGIVKIRRGVSARDPRVGFEGVVDLVGSAGLALMLTPEGMIAGAVMSLGASLAQHVRDYRQSHALPSHAKTDILMKAGLSLGGLLFFFPGGFLPGTLLVGGISAARQVMLRTAQIRQFTRALP